MTTDDLIFLGSVGIHTDVVATFETVADAPEGGTIFVACGVTGASEYASSLSDGTNAYTGSAAQWGGLFSQRLLWAQNSAALPSGSTIQIDFPGSGQGTITNVVAVAFWAPASLTQSGDFNFTTDNSSTPAETASSVSAGALVVDVTTFTGSAIFTEDSGFTAVGSATQGIASLHVGAMVCGATGDVSAAPSLSASRIWGLSVTAFD